MSRAKENKQTTHGSAAGEVIAFPARTPLIGGRQLHFMFSVLQVVDVLKLVEIEPYSSEKDYVQGIADWRGRPVPVICLEQALGLKRFESGMPQRNIVVRGVWQDDQGEIHDLFAVCEVGAAARQYQLPMVCPPMDPPEHMPGVALLKGMYAMDEYVFMIVDLEKIVAGLYPVRTREVIHVL